jgi:hypothetical protein
VERWVSFLRNVLGLVRDGGILAGGLLAILFLLFGRDPASVSVRQWAHIVIVGVMAGAIPGLFYFARSLMVPSIGYFESRAVEWKNATLRMTAEGVRAYVCASGLSWTRRLVNWAMILFMVGYFLLLLFGAIKLADKYSKPGSHSPAAHLNMQASNRTSSLALA